MRKMHRISDQAFSRTAPLVVGFINPMATLNDPQREVAKKILRYCGVSKTDIFRRLRELGRS